MDKTTQPLSEYVSEPLRAGDPDVAGPLAVFPLLGGAVEVKFLSFARGREHGVVLREVDGRASVNDLVVRNTGAVPVLLYEGEEVLGAQQNRTFDVSVLVPAGEERRVRLAELAGAVRRREGQLGALVAIGGRFVVLDWVGRDDVFADLFGPLVQGYALDALEAGEAGAPSTSDAQGFLDLVLGTDAAGAESIGLGLDLRFAADGVAGCGLATDGELVQLTAFPEDGETGGRSAGASSRVSRPSQRRR